MTRESDILKLIDETLAGQELSSGPGVDPFSYGEHLPEEEIDAYMNSTSPIAKRSAADWVSDGTHNDDPALLGGYGR